MLDSVDFSGRPFHFIGVGGIGMSALAHVLAERKLPVSGSDIRLNHITQRLQDLGVHIFWKQEAANLKFFQTANQVPEPVSATSASGPRHLGSDPPAVNSAWRSTPSDTLLPQVICSTAIGNANPEYQAALDLGCPVFHRSDLLAALIKTSESIAVAGTHGKTTTSSLIGYLLFQAGLDPTIIVGGEVEAWEGNARLGQGRLLVAEADESDGSLVKFAAHIGVVTNMELDHPDHYSSLEQVIDTFTTFTQQCQTFVGCIDCTNVRDALKPPISYSLNPDTNATYTVDQIHYGSNGTTARVWERGQLLGAVQLRLLGKHNLSNALAAIAVGRMVGLEFSAIAAALATFGGARRRFELRGQADGIRFIDDYAHHPSEVQATLAAARLTIEGSTEPGRVIAIFQPHRYSRTLTFLEEFSQSFADADVVVLTDIYSAGEPDLGKVNGQQLAEAIATHHAEVYYQPNLQAVQTFLTDLLRAGDLALFLGAGNINQLIPDLLTTYQGANQGVSQDSV